MKKYYVYGLKDPETGEIRYVGKSPNPKNRYKEHVAEARTASRTEKQRWIAGLLARSLHPSLVILATAPDEPAARELEAEFCHLHIATVLNIHDPRKGAKDLRKRA